MPLFHIHGLIGAVLASIHAGASIVCTPGFEITRFYQDMSKMSPTWYTAVPTMHQAVLGSVSENAEVVAKHHLRFIRSCSSALPPTVLAEMMETFGVPVIEAYGMTEAAHQMTCNPFPPLPCKPGSVGMPTGVDVAIMDPSGNLAPPESTGEIVIRGDNVTLGYSNNPEANSEAFQDGWFRTGDQGHFDQDGYLFLTGRLKEMINRGGENISPREIDDVLLEHPQIDQAITFAVPHPTLGESVAAAVVSRADTPPSEKDVREFVADRVSEFKVPQRVLFLDEIPKGPTGKPQRIGLADKLGLTSTTQASSNSTTEPATQTEKRLQKLWQGILSSEVSIGRESHFFELGGDSLRATQLVNRVRSEMGIELEITQIFEAPTLAELAMAIEESTPAPKRKAG
jgi:acyl-CoA synthetase (AMP-forming)/AMP-acid ligase II/acyl carrier protein